MFFLLNYQELEMTCEGRETEEVTMGVSQDHTQEQGQVEDTEAPSEVDDAVSR